MTNDEIRIAIAKRCGRKPGAYYCGQCRECVAIETVTSGGYHDKCGGNVHVDLPNYPEDLNAMHEAEKVLNTATLHTNYGVWLARLTKYKNGSNPWALMTATASQRCEAFLRTIGKWKD